MLIGYRWEGPRSLTAGELHSSVGTNEVNGQRCSAARPVQLFAYPFESKL